MNILRFPLTGFTQQSNLWEADSSPTGQKTSAFYGSLRFLTVFTSQLPVPILHNFSKLQFPGLSVMFSDRDKIQYNIL
jgi:hypothetical protein